LKVFKLFHRAGPIESVKTGSKAAFHRAGHLHLSIEREHGLRLLHKLNIRIAFLLHQKMEKVAERSEVG
jgi:hypothetical protein